MEGKETKMGFNESVVPQLFRGKTKTYRLREHNVNVGDVLDFEDSQSGRVIGKGKIKKTEEKKISEVDLKDKNHGATYESINELIKAFKSHYPEREVTPETKVFVYTYEFEPNEKNGGTKSESAAKSMTSEEPEAVEKVPVVVPITPEEAPEVIPQIVEPQEEEGKGMAWTPKTSLGKQVLERKIAKIDEILLSGKKIIEPEIVDYLVPNLQSELALVGGRSGKGGGSKRIPIRITAKMHSSGRRFRTSAFFVVGDGDGLIGIGKGSSVEPRTAMEKSLRKAKLNIIRIKRGCGDWECGCGLNHSIPFKTRGHAGSVRVELMPAPKGIGLVADNETKKILKMAGIKDVWVKTYGNTSNRINLISAVFDALKKLYVYEK